MASEPLRLYVDVLMAHHPSIRTQARIAEVSGYSPQAISKWLREGTKSPNAMATLAATFGIEVDWFDLNLETFKQQVKARFQGATRLAAVAKATDLIGIRLWNASGQSHLIGAENAAPQFGMVPRNRALGLCIPQHTRMALEINLQALKSAERIVALEEVFLFSEDAHEVLCLRPSVWSRRALAANETLIVPDDKPAASNTHPLVREPSVADQLGTTRIVLGIFTAGHEPDEKRARLAEKLLALELSACPHALIDELMALSHVRWFKRTFNVIP